MAVLKQRASEIDEFQALQSFKSAACWLKPLRPTISNPDVCLQCPLWVCPELEDYQTDCGPLQLGLAGQHQRSNASLALQLSHTWLQRRRLQGMWKTLPSLHVWIAFHVVGKTLMG